ncbi:hypothetical protein E4U42_000985, partial [Claviceps africana]
MPMKRATRPAARCSALARSHPELQDSLSSMTSAGLFQNRTRPKEANASPCDEEKGRLGIGSGGIDDAPRIMATPPSPVPDLRDVLSKEPSNHLAPPAYSPFGRRRPDMSSSPTATGRQPVLVDGPSLASLVAGSSVQVPDDHPRRSGISLRINTSVRVSGRNNHV